jgi:hypothetical protein
MAGSDSRLQGPGNFQFGTTKWVNVTDPVNIVNGQNQVVFPVGATNGFYHLELQ